VHYFTFPFLGMIPKFRKATIKMPRLSARPQNNSVLTEGIFITFDIPVFSKICREISSFFEM
jgi:hypothetical protein